MTDDIIREAEERVDLWCIAHEGYDLSEEWEDIIIEDEQHD